MPSTMIHLLVAHEIKPKSPDLFWVGNFAPDFTNDRQIKDEIHLRNAVNRFEALRQFRKTINDNDPFESGWLLHLFVDACWDEIKISAFQQKHKNNPDDEQWFLKYRQEIVLASYYLFHHMDWAPQIWNQILKADLSSIQSQLPITRNQIEWLREMVYKKHSESNVNSLSIEYNKEQLLDFSRETALRYKDWVMNK